MKKLDASDFKFCKVKRFILNQKISTFLKIITNIALQFNLNLQKLDFNNIKARFGFHLKIVSICIKN